MPAIPVPQAGRRSHEAAIERSGIVYMTSDGEQYVRGVTQDGRLYDFAKTTTNTTQFCGACFDRDGQTLYLNQQGERGGLPDGPPNGRAVTYAIYGPFAKRSAGNGKSFGNGR